MAQRVTIAMLAAILTLAACSNETPTSLDPHIGYGRQQSSTIPEAVPLSFEISPPTVIGGAAGTPNGTVTVESAASFDRSLRVSSNNPTVLPFLSTGMIVPAFTTKAGLLIIPSAVSTPTVVTIFITGGGVTVSADLKVLPPDSALPPATLSSLTVNPAIVNAGAIATGTLTVPAPAPPGGVVISVFSRIPGSAAVPPTVTVPEGATQATFPITTFPGFPNSATSVLLTATTADTLVSSSITVVTGNTIGTPTLLSPAADARFPRGSTVMFDWSNVSGAPTYTIQIDDSDKFSAPLIVNQSTTASQFSTSSLPALTMWWRVRAISSSGVAGAWSSARRFQVK